MLKDIRDFLLEHGPQETAAVARHLGSEESAVLAMLEFLEQRGQVRRIEMACGGGGCGDCGGCGKKEKRVETAGTIVVFWSAGAKRDLKAGAAQ